jgi:hypothetical protein
MGADPILMSVAFGSALKQDPEIFAKPKDPAGRCQWKTTSPSGKK